MVSIKNILKLAYFSVATALTVTRRDFVTVSSDIDAMRTNVKALDSAVAAWDGTSLFGALPIISPLQNLKTSIKKATADSLATPSLTLSEAVAIDSQTVSATEDIHKLLQDFKAKRDAFKKFSLVGFVKPEITELKGLTTGFANAITASVPAVGREIAKQRRDAILRDFDEAARFFEL